MKNLRKRIKGWILILLIATGGMAGIPEVNAGTEKGPQDLGRFREISTETWTVLNGKRLALMREYMGEDLVVEKKGIQLEIPGELVRKWKIGWDQTIQVLISQDSDSSYRIEIYKGEKKITHIPGSRVVFPVQELFPYENPETIVVTDQEGEKMTFFLDGKQKFLTVFTEETGIFFVRSRSRLIQKKPLAQVGIIMATGLTMGICSRRGKTYDIYKREE